VRIRASTRCTRIQRTHAETYAGCMPAHVGALARGHIPPRLVRRCVCTATCDRTRQPVRAGLGKRVHGFPRAAAATTGCGRRATGGGQARPGASAGLQRPFCLAGPARASWAVRGGPPAADALLALEAQVHDGQVVHCHMRAHPFRGHAQNVAGRAAHTGEPRSGLGYNHRPAPTPGSRPGGHV